MTAALFPLCGDDCNTNGEHTSRGDCQQRHPDHTSQHRCKPGDDLDDRLPWQERQEQA